MSDCPHAHAAYDICAQCGKEVWTIVRELQCDLKRAREELRAALARAADLDETAKLLARTADTLATIARGAKP